MKSWEEGLGAVLTRVETLAFENVDLDQALGRILREAVRAPSDLPASDLSMMDGYAVGTDTDGDADLRLVGRIAAGQAPALQIGPGEAVRIFTGAPVPEGCARVIPQENVDLLPEGRIRIRDLPGPCYIRKRGSEALAGAPVLASGIRLRAPELAILAALGHTRPAVGIQPKIAHIVLGDELVDPSEVPPVGAIRDTNSTFVRALLAAENLRTTTHIRVPDAPDRIEAALRSIGDDPDLILVSGGASVGDHDYARACLDRVGFAFLFDRWRLRPGKPSAALIRGRQIALCLPGNPVAHLVVFHLLVRPVLRKFAGATDPTPRSWSGRLLAIPAGKPDPRHTFWPASCGPEGVRPARFLTSGDGMSLAGVNALISLQPGAAPPLPGTEVSYLPLWD
jgi:molybdopterin molybdotransferase